MGSLKFGLTVRAKNGSVKSTHALTNSLVIRSEADGPGTKLTNIFDSVPCYLNLHLTDTVGRVLGAGETLQNLFAPI